MSINNTKSMKKTKDFFNDDFEVIYQEDYSDILRDEFDEEDDDYSDVLSTLSELDNANENDYLAGIRDSYDEEYSDSYDDDNENDDGYNDRRHSHRHGSESGSDKDSKKKSGKKHKAPNLVSPAARTVKTGGKVIFKIINLLLRTASLILTAVITYILTVHFWKNHSAYGDVFRAFTEANYTLAAYAAVTLFLILFEFFTFLLILFRSKRHDRNNNSIDTGRGLFSFIFIYAGSVLAYMLNELIPASPAPLQGVQGALLVYGSLNSVLLPLCAAGIVSCLTRRFLVR